MGTALPSRRSAAGPWEHPMTALAPHPIVARPAPAPETTKGSRLSNLLRTTDHKTIGLMYLVTSFVWFVIGGLMAMLMRGGLGRAGLQVLLPGQDKQRTEEDKFKSKH